MALTVDRWVMEGQHPAVPWQLASEDEEPAGKDEKGCCRRLPDGTQLQGPEQHPGGGAVQVVTADEAGIVALRDGSSIS